LHNAGKRDEAEQVFRSLADVQQRLLGMKHPDVISTRSKLAVCKWNQAISLWNQDNAGAALSQFENVAVIRADILGNDHPDTKEAYEMVTACQRLLG